MDGINDTYKVGTLIVTPSDSGWFYSIVTNKAIIPELNRLLADKTVKKISISKLESEEN